MLCYKIDPAYQYLEDEIRKIPEIFPENGSIVTSGRNVIKRIEVAGLLLNVKSFKIPHWINKIAYAYFRKSKARRSFEYARLLLAKGIGTPAPVSYIEQRNRGGLTSSYYISLHLDNVRTFKEMTETKPEGWQDILRAFTRFTYDFQQKGIYFVDHSPGNTLIRQNGKGEFCFYLVDLNRMEFKVPGQEGGLKNFYRLGMDREMCVIVATEYARLTGGNADEMSRKLIGWVEAHNEAVRKKKAKRKKRS